MFKKKNGVVNHGIFCEECGSKKLLCNFFKTRYCLKCRKKTVDNIRISVFETMQIKESMKMRKFTSGIKKFLTETCSGWFESHKYKKGVNKIRVVDREKDEYHEIVRNCENDKIVHECHEPLSKHKK
jgi:hypothetical protein